MHETSAQGWCTGKTQRDGMEREAGGGMGMGNTCKSMAESCQCMAKPLQYCKVISLQLIKINEKKNLTSLLAGNVHETDMSGRHFNKQFLGLMMTITIARMY